MRKLTTCVLSVGILMLVGFSDTEAWPSFGKKKTSTESVAYSIFGANTKALIDAATNLKSGLADVQKGITTATGNMKKQTIDLKTFDKTATITPIVFISERLTNIAAFFGTVVSLLEKEIAGLKAINKSKSVGNADEITGRNNIRLSRKVMKIMLADLASIQANIALIGKLVKGKNKRISNAGAIRSIFENLSAVIKGEKKNSTFGKKRNLINLFDTYEDESSKITNSVQDEEMQELFTDSKVYIAAGKEIVNVVDKLIVHIISYTRTGDSSNLENFASECEEVLGGMKNALNSQKERYDELDDLKRNNRGNVRKRASQLDSDPTFRSEKGKNAQGRSRIKQRSGQLESSLSSRSDKARKMYEDSQRRYEEDEAAKRRYKEYTEGEDDFGSGY